ncbi:hypothetical protein QNH41_11370 [Bacillus halotolerans]|uniref:hypothetical protein n=1 Tax=Bacillus halotolerans TaxID=260554 RepID=UPI0024C0F769|nr:hypothetical protein [Bacillus halotolerans]WHY22658.1 hypothetical protein QNH41_11370 [Bacillus halotolerans]
MTMIVAVKWSNNIIMTADKRQTETDSCSGELLKIKSDDYIKIKIIDNKYIVSFAGSTLIAEKAFELLNQNVDVLNLHSIDPLGIFRDSFKYGKAHFEAVYPGIKPVSVFYVGFMRQHEPKLFGFSSDDDYSGLEIEELSVKMNSNSNGDAEKEAIRFISAEVLKRDHYYKNPRNFARLNFKAIKRADDEMIGKTAYSVVISSDGIKEYHHN